MYITDHYIYMYGLRGMSKHTAVAHQNRCAVLGGSVTAVCECEEVEVYVCVRRSRRICVLSHLCGW